MWEYCSIPLSEDFTPNFLPDCRNHLTVETGMSLVFILVIVDINAFYPYYL